MIRMLQCLDYTYHEGTIVTFPLVALLTDSSNASAMFSYFNTLKEVVERSVFSHSLQESLMCFLLSAEIVAYQPNSMQPVTVIPLDRFRPTVMVSGFLSRQPQMQAIEWGLRPRIKDYVMGPPPKASKRTLKPWALMASAYSFSQSPLVTITCCAPSDLSKSACSSFLTMLSRGMPRRMHLLLSILPKAEAAAVWMIPFLWGLASNCSVMPTAVSGLTMPEAAVWRGTSSSMTNALIGEVMMNYAHDPPSSTIKLTRFPNHSCTFSPLASTTLPVPSIPITLGNGTGEYPPVNLPLSEGLTVEASTLTSSCPSLGLGTGHSLRVGMVLYCSITSALCVAISDRFNIFSQHIHLQKSEKFSV